MQVFGIEYIWFLLAASIMTYVLSFRLMRVATKKGLSLPIFLNGMGILTLSVTVVTCILHLIGIGKVTLK